jgi:hypothetical protein
MMDRARICVLNPLRSLCASMAMLLLYAPAQALSPDLRIGQFYHMARTAKEGAPTATEGFAQTVISGSVVRREPLRRFIVGET